MGGVGLLRVLGYRSRRACTARSARRSAPAFSACDRSAGRRWCRSSRRAKTTARRRSKRWRSDWCEHFGAPDHAPARSRPREEVAFAASLCNHRIDTLIAVHRSCEDGEIRETFRTLRPRNGPKPLRAFSFLEVEGDEDEPAEHVDLIRLRAGRAASEGFLALLRPSSARPRRRRRPRRHRRIPEGLSGAAGARAAAGGLRGGKHACMPRCWPIRAGAVSAGGDRGASRIPMRARTGS